jgi:hypothetical protein
MKDSESQMKFIMSLIKFAESQVMNWFSFLYNFKEWMCLGYRWSGFWLGISLWWL